MKKLLFAVAVLMGLAACTEKSNTIHPEWTYDSVVYEVNIRQFSPEGTFKGVEEQLPRLKDLGVDILWLMPMYEIGTEGRKGTLGSYYAISDYKKVNPEFGTMKDFEHLLKAAHKLGFKVILDWVANQTAPDHVWMKEKPADFYERDAQGNAIWEYDWTDTRSLNYENQEVWWAQDDAMRFWLKKGVDGFRCDAAGEVPAEFWYGILPKMNADYPNIYLLAEAERDNLADASQTFDANYAWELHHLLNGLAQGSKTVQDLKDYIARDAARFPREAFRLTFTSNHDENSWAGSEFERMGPAAMLCAVLCFTLPGSQPMVYTGQEIGLVRRLQFFEKDPIEDWSENVHTTMWKKLISFKHENPALRAGELGGPIQYIDAPEGVMAFSREVEGNKVIVVTNFGVTPAVEEPAPAPDKKVAANDNRPQGETVAVPFLNMKADPVEMTIELDGEYVDGITGAVYSGTLHKELLPGMFMLLSRK
jgi:glycosidase